MRARKSSADSVRSSKPRARLRGSRRGHSEKGRCSEGTAGPLTLPDYRLNAFRRSTRSRVPPRRRHAYALAGASQSRDGGAHAGSGLGPRHLQARSLEEWHGGAGSLADWCPPTASGALGAKSRQLERAAELDYSQKESEVIVLPDFFLTG